MIKDFYSFFPKPLFIYKEWTDFISKVKSYYDLYLRRIKQFAWFRRVENNILYKELAYHEGAYFLESDNDRQIRQAIIESRIINRQPTRFDVWKPIIDRITSGDCLISKYPIKTTSFIIAKSKIGSVMDTIGGTTTYSGKTIGNDFIVGSSLIGQYPDPNYSGTTNWIAGYVCIDLNMGATPTEDQLKEIAKRMYALKESWFIILYGYVIANEFYPYSRLDYYNL